MSTKHVSSRELALRWFGERNIRPGISKRCGHMTDGDVDSLTSLIERIRRDAGITVTPLPAASPKVEF